MSEKVYLHILILCGILRQGIIVTLSDEDTRATSDFIVRKRRVINLLPNGTNPTRMEDANYLVNIKENNRARCVGAILSHYSVITAASCVRLPITHYHVLSGSGYDTRSTFHDVTSKTHYFGKLPHQDHDGIALITIDPPFVFRKNTGFIPLFEGPLLPGAHVTVRGWGGRCRVQSEQEASSRRLRTIVLPIMNHGECQHIYRGFYLITEKHLCTHDSQQYCTMGDVGAPLVYNNMLAGIHVWKESHRGPLNPDVYINLQSGGYHTWIRENALLM